MPLEPPDRILRLARRLRGDRAGSIAIIAAVCLVLLAGVTGLALDLAQAYAAKAASQRIADQSALAAAFAYNNSSSSSTAAQNAAQSLATTNGIGAGSVNAQIVNSPSGDGNKAVKVTVTSPVAVSPFGRIATASPQRTAGLLTFNVSSVAYAEITQNTVPCLVALGSSGIAASGGVTVTANGCAISSGGNVTVSNGPTITAQGVYAVGTISPTGSACNGSGCIVTSPTAGQTFPGSSAPTDPYANANVFGRLPTVAAETAPSFPSGLGSVGSGGAAIACSGSNLTVPSGIHGGIAITYYPACSAINFTGGAETDIGGSGLQLSGVAVTMNFAAGTYKIAGICISGSSAMTMNIATGAVLEIWPASCNGASVGIGLSGSTSLTVNGPGTYYIQGGINQGSSGALSFNNGTGSATSTFYISGGITISNGSASFPSGTYAISSGNASGWGIQVSTNGGVTFGNGSYKIGAGISLGGGDTLTFGGALNSSAVFQVMANTASSCLMSGATGSSNCALITGGGGSLTIGSYTDVDLNGNVEIQGNLSLGSGAYTINGTFDAAGAGGNSITGTGVSIVSAGAIAFGAGYSTVNLSAPTTLGSSTVGSASTVVLASESTGGSSVTAGATSTQLVGAVYTPNGALSVSGAGHISGGGGCVEVIASSMNFSGGGSLSTTCSLSGSSGGGAVTVALVQ